MNSNAELKPGWLKSDLERASKRVQELKIAKSKFTEFIEEEVHEDRVEVGHDDEAETLNC
jgi:hypothetical protein